MQYKRSTAKGATFFFTVVTHARRQILCHESNVSLLRETFRSVMERHPFTIDALVLMLDHLHRFRFWGIVDELEDRVLRVVTLNDKRTIHNAFPDRGYKP